MTKGGIMMNYQLLFIYFNHYIEINKHNLSIIIDIITISNKF